MVAILKQGATKENIKKLFDKLSKQSKNEGVNTLKFCGKIKLGEDALAIQKQMRNEW